MDKTEIDKVDRLDPKLDIVFKLLFRQNDDILRSLLTAVLQPSTPITKVRVLNPEIDNKEHTDDKGIVLDIRVDLEDGRQVDVEMQTEHRLGIRRRALYYWARMYSQQIQRGQNYTDLLQSVVIFFLDYKEFDWTNWHSVFKVKEDTHGGVFSDVFELHTIELPKHKELAEEVSDEERSLANWCRFFDAEDAAELRRLSKEDPMIGKANGLLTALSCDPKARRLAQDRKKALDAYKLDIWEATREGEARGEIRGEARGEAKGQRGILLKLLQLKFGGNLTTELEAKVSSATTEQLDLWAERILECDRVEDIFRA